MFRRPAVLAAWTIATALGEGCRGGGPAGDGGDAGTDQSGGGDDGPAGLTLERLEPPTGPYGTYVTLRGSGFDPPGDGTGGGRLLLDGAEVSRRSNPLGTCPAAAPAPCLAWYRWTDTEIVVVLPIGHPGGALSVEVAGATTAALAWLPTEQAPLTGDRGPSAGLALVNGSLVTVQPLGGKLVLRVVGRTAPEGITLSVGEGIDGPPALGGGSCALGATDCVEVYAPGLVGSATHLYRGRVADLLVGKPLYDTGVALVGGQLSLLGGGTFGVWAITPTGTVLADGDPARESTTAGFDFKGNDYFVAWSADNDALVVAVNRNRTRTSYAYDLYLAGLSVDAGKVSATLEPVVGTGADFVRQVAVRRDADGTPEIFYVENQNATTNVPLVLRREAGGWTSRPGPTIPLGAQGARDGFHYLVAPYVTGPFGKSRVIAEQIGDAGVPRAISGDVMPIFQDPIAVLYDPRGGRVGPWTWIARDRDPAVPPIEGQKHRWVRPAPPMPARTSPPLPSTPGPGAP